MKNFTCIFLMLLGAHVFAQESTILPDFEHLNYSCEDIKVDSDKNQIIFTGNVNFKSKEMIFEHASKVVYCKKEGKIYVSGAKAFSTQSSLVVHSSRSRKRDSNSFYYNLKDRMVI